MRDCVSQRRDWRSLNLRAVAKGEGRPILRERPSGDAPHRARLNAISKVFGKEGSEMGRGGARLGAGRKKKPDSLRALITNPRGRQPAAIDLFPVASATPPQHLDADARAVWSQYATLLISRGLLSSGDAAKFEMFCLACGRARQIDRAIRAGGGITAETARLTVAEIKYMQLADKLGALFGLDPIARSRLKAEPPQTRDWLDALTGDDDSPIQ